MISFHICQENKTKFLIYIDVRDTTATAHRFSGFVHPGIPGEQPWAEKMLYLFLTFCCLVVVWFFFQERIGIGFGGGGRGLLLGGCLFSLSPRAYGDE